MVAQDAELGEHSFRPLAEQLYLATTDHLFSVYFLFFTLHYRWQVVLIFSYGSDVKSFSQTIYLRKTIGDFVDIMTQDKAKFSKHESI